MATEEQKELLSQILGFVPKCKENRKVEVFLPPDCVGIAKAITKEKTYLFDCYGGVANSIDE